MDGHNELHVDRLVVEKSRLVLPGANCNERRGNKQRRARDHLHLDHAAGLVDHCIDNHISLYPRLSGQHRIKRLWLEDHPGRPDMSAHADRRADFSGWWRGSPRGSSRNSTQNSAKYTAHLPPWDAARDPTGDSDDICIGWRPVLFCKYPLPWGPQPGPPP